MARVPKYVLAQMRQRVLGDLDTLTLMGAPKDRTAKDAKDAKEPRCTQKRSAGSLSIRH